MSAARGGDTRPRTGTRTRIPITRRTRRRIRAHIPTARPRRDGFRGSGNGATIHGAGGIAPGSRRTCVEEPHGITTTNPLDGGAAGGGRPCRAGAGARDRRATAPAVVSGVTASAAVSALPATARASRAAASTIRRPPARGAAAAALAGDARALRAVLRRGTGRAVRGLLRDRRAARGLRTRDRLRCEGRRRAAAAR